MMAYTLNDCENHVLLTNTRAQRYDDHWSPAKVVKSYRADVVHIHDEPRFDDYPEKGGVTSTNQLDDIVAVFLKK